MTDFATDKVTYIRAYANSPKGTAYGETKVLFMPDFLDKGDYIILGDVGIAVQKKDVGTGSWGDMKRLCESSTVGGYTDWRLPTINELASLYELKIQIGNFITDGSGKSYYWSDESSYNYSHYYIDFSDGSRNSSNAISHSARAVRTPTK